jgi:hypothetical protein
VRGWDREVEGGGRKAGRGAGLKRGRTGGDVHTLRVQGLGFRFEVHTSQTYIHNYIHTHIQTICRHTDSTSLA